MDRKRYRNIIPQQDWTLLVVRHAVQSMEETATSNAKVIHWWIAKQCDSDAPTLENVVFALGMLHGGGEIDFLDPAQLPCDALDILWKRCR